MIGPPNVDEESLPPPGAVGVGPLLGFGNGVGVVDGTGRLTVA